MSNYPLDKENLVSFFFQQSWSIKVIRFCHMEEFKKKNQKQSSIVLALDNLWKKHQIMKYTNQVY